MPYISDAEWSRIDELAPRWSPHTFHMIPGQADLWHVRSEELLAAAQSLRRHLTEQQVKELLK